MTQRPATLRARPRQALSAGKYWKVTKSYQSPPGCVKGKTGPVGTPPAASPGRCCANARPWVISFMAKMARGAMARFIITQRVDRASGLKDFQHDRYRYIAKASSETRLVFRRKFIPVAAA